MLIEIMSRKVVGASYRKLLIEIMSRKVVGAIDLVLPQSEGRPLDKCRVEGEKEGLHACRRVFDANYRRGGRGLVSIAFCPLPRFPVLASSA